MGQVSSGKDLIDGWEKEEFFCKDIQNGHVLRMRMKVYIPSSEFRV